MTAFLLGIIISVSFIAILIMRFRNTKKNKRETMKAKTVKAGEFLKLSEEWLSKMGRQKEQTRFIATGHIKYNPMRITVVEVNGYTVHCYHESFLERA